MNIDNALNIIGRLHFALEESRDSIVLKESGPAIIKGIFDYIFHYQNILDKYLDEENDKELSNEVIRKLSLILQKTITAISDKNRSRLRSTEGDLAFNTLLEEAWVRSFDVYKESPNKPFMECYSDGSIKSISLATDGNYNGTYVSWHKNGELEFIGQHTDGKPTGFWTQFDIMGFQNGTYEMKTEQSNPSKEEEDDGSLSKVLIGSLAVAALAGIFKSKTISEKKIEVVTNNIEEVALRNK